MSSSSLTFIQVLPSTLLGITDGSMSVVGCGIIGVLFQRNICRKQGEPSALL